MTTVVSPTSRVALVTPLTCQFFLEDHPVRYGHHHLARIRTALESSNE